MARFDLKHFMSWPPMSMMKSNWAKSAGGSEVRLSLHHAVVGVEALWARSSQ